MTKHWHLWRDDDHSPAMNMAVDELLLQQADQLSGQPLIRIYGWDKPAITIGYIQDYAAVENPDNLPIIRRPTGGGIVYHQHDLTYTALIPAAHAIKQLDRLESYRVFHRAIVRMLQVFGLQGQLVDDAPPVPDRASMQCFVTPTIYDVVCDNRKIAGAAQRRTKKGILHQGSISLDVADGNREKLVSELINGIESEFKISFLDYSPPAGILAEAAKLATAKFATEAWNRDKQETPSF